MKTGSIIRITLTGREAISGKVFETTDEKVAKESGLYREGEKYGPTTIMMGRGNIVKGLEEALQGMEAGEKKHVKLAPEKAFGQRRRELVVVVPLQEFKQRKIMPVSGLVIEIDDRYGRVQTVSGGRVRVDFNSDLAGKEVEYDVKVENELTTAEEQTQALAEKYFAYAPSVKAKVIGKKATVTIAPLKEGREKPKEFGMLVKLFEKVVKDNVEKVLEVEVKEEGVKKGKSPPEAAGKTEKADK